MTRQLTEIALATLNDRYLLDGEDWEGLIARVAEHYSNDREHQKRLEYYMQQLWFLPATPILANGGAGRGLPISCYLNEAQDSLDGIHDTLSEAFWLAAKGGGVGAYWGNLRALGDSVSKAGATTGIIPFIQMLNAQTLAISQGSLRRGSAAVYLPIHHPEIIEFLEIRRPSGGDLSRKALNLHHAVVIDDKFMNAVINGDTYDLLSPKDGHVAEKVDARTLWIKILETRIETGEPYILFIDTMNNNKPEIQKKLNIKLKTSNLCTEITLPTGYDHIKGNRTAVCCLSSLNLEYYDEWKDNPDFILDIMYFLDNVMNDFIKRADPYKFKNAIYSAERERSVGLGVMGFHTYLQSKGLPFGGVLSKSYNNFIFKNIKSKADEASHIIASQRGPCKDGIDATVYERFTNKIAIAPTASISIIAGNTSPGIEPNAANSYVSKTLAGSFYIKNKFLERVLEKYNKNNSETWKSIDLNSGSVQHLDFLTQQEKDVFKTAHEIDQRWIIELAGDRQYYICQAQSVNLFLPADIHKRDLHNLHLLAWKKGLKSLYYCRSIALQRMEKEESLRVKQKAENDNIDYDECLACQ